MAVTKEPPTGKGYMYFFKRIHQGEESSEEEVKEEPPEEEKEEDPRQEQKGWEMMYY